MRILRSRLIAASAILAVFGAMSGLVLPSASASAAIYSATFASWSDGSNGTIGSTAITTSTLGKVPISVNFSGTDFDPAGSSLGALDIGNTYGVSMAFGSALVNPAFYLKYFEGKSTFAGVQSYTLASTGGSCTWTIVSGFSSASITGSTLTLADDSVNNGIILCTGSVTGISIAAIGSGQARPAQVTLATLAAIPDPSPTTTTSTTTTTTSTTIDPVAPAFTG